MAMEMLGVRFEANYEKAFSRVKKMGDSFRAFGTHADGAGKRIAGLAQRNKRLGQSFVNLNKDVNRSSQTLGKFSGMLRGAGFVTSLLLAGRSLGKFIESSMDAIETQNLFNVALGDMAVESGKALKAMTDLTGLDLTNTKNAVGTYSLLARSMGFSSEQANRLSNNTYRLALDLSSLTNVPIAQVLQDLRSGLLGQSETVYKYGLDVTEAALKEEALAQGISKSVRNMNQGEKMALRYSVMLKQSSIVHGDFARTIEEPANQLRILKERFSTLSRAIGNMFIPALAFILPYANAVVQVLTEVANAIARLLGFVPKEDENFLGNLGDGSGEDEVADVSSGIGGAVKKAKELKRALLGIDELNVLPDQTASDSGGGGTGPGGPSILPDMNLGQFDSLFELIKTKSTDIANSIKEAFKNALSGIDFGPISSAFDNLVSSIEPLVNIGREGLSWVWENVLKPLGEWTIEEFLPAIINLLAEAFRALYNVLKDLEPYAKYIWEEFLKPLAQWTGEIIIQALDTLTESLKGFNDEQARTQENDVFNSEGFIGAIGTIGALATALGLLWSIGQIGSIAGAFLGIAVALDGLKNIPVVGGMFQGLSEKALGLGIKVQSLGNTIATFGAVKIAIVIAIIALLVKAFIELWQENEEFRRIFTEVFENITGLLKNIWESILKPIFEALIDIFKDIWETGLKPLWNSFKEAFGAIAMFIGDVLNRVVFPILNVLIKIFGDTLVATLRNVGEIFSLVFSIVANVISSFFNFFKERWDSIRQIFNGIIDFITGVFTGNWKKAWNGLKDIVGGVFDGMWSVVKFPLNLIIDAVNTLIRGMNKFQINIPAFIAKIMGLGSAVTFGFNIPTIPRLARGGILQDGGALFEAGEFGKAEMIGSYGGKTTVMPLENTDFVGAMYNAVFDAVVSAMGQQEGGDVVLRVGELELGRASIAGIKKVGRVDGRIDL